MAEYSVVGKRVPRRDGIAKATGQAIYTFDVEMRGMLYGKILRSPYPHARIVSIDTNGAEKLPGVKAVATGKDTWGTRFAFVDTPRYPADQPILAEEKVRYVGEAVAVVAATDEDIAEEALDLIEVEYEPLPAVFDPVEAMNEGAPQVHGEQIPARGRTCAWQDWGVGRQARSYNPVNNIGATVLISYGDIEKGFAESDYIREDRFVIPSTAHAALEPHCAVASYDPFTGHLDFWCSRMDMEVRRYWLSKTLGIPIGKIRIHKAYVGGAFGGKVPIFDFEILAAFLSRKTGRPVKIVLTRDEVFTATNSSVRFDVTVKQGVKKDGTLMAKHVRLISDMGAYRGSAPVALFLAHSYIDAVYNIPNLLHDGIGVYTNKSKTQSKRGHGAPQLAPVIEAQMDWIAKDLGLDPVELRLKNLRKKGDVLPNGDRLDSHGLPDCIKKAAEAAGWKEKRGKLRPNQGIGIGICAMFNGSGYWPFTGSAIVKLNLDGTVILYNGQIEFGQGVDTSMCQVVAEELGLQPEDVNLVSADTELCPTDYNNWLSAGTYVSTKACLKAAQDVKAQLLKAAAEMLGANVDDLAVRNRRVYMRTDPDRSVAYDEVLRYNIQKHGGDPIIGKGFCKPVPDIEFYPSLSKGTGRWTDAYSFVAVVAEVEIDRETGRVKVLKLTIGDDCGFQINPLICEGQLESQGVMGMGDALFEEIIFEEGRQLNPSFVDYHLARALDAPEMEIIDACDYEPKGPFGAKEVGEGARGPVIAAVFNAVYDAVGVKIKSLPLHPEKILKALGEQSARP